MPQCNLNAEAPSPFHAELVFRARRQPASLAKKTSSADCKNNNSRHVTNASCAAPWMARRGASYEEMRIGPHSCCTTNARILTALRYEAAQPRQVSPPHYPLSDGIPTTLPDYQLLCAVLWCSSCRAGRPDHALGYLVVSLVDRKSGCF